MHKHQLTDVMGATDIFKGVKGAISKILRSLCRKMAMIYLQGLIRLLITTSESAATEPGSEISHFQNSLCLYCWNNLSCSHIFSYSVMDGGVSATRNGTLLEYLAFDAFPSLDVFVIRSN